jgi:hypothetical protein
MSRCLVERVEPRNSLGATDLADDWRCGSAGRNAVVGVGSLARQVRSNKARQGRAGSDAGGAVRACSCGRLQEACRPRVHWGLQW